LAQGQAFSRVAVGRLWLRLGQGHNDRAMARNMQTEITDVLIVGGGVNGAGIARDAAGRGLSVTLVEQGDLASATSSASTKLFHGGLRYLEQYDFSNDLKQWSKENYLIVFINCCSRSVVFNQNFNGLSYFLDLNYKTIFSEKMKDKKNFEDGKRLLISQAIIAAEFFNIIRPLTLPCEKQLTDEFSQLEAEIYHYLLK